MYSSFQVQNFRGFKDLRLDDLARVNLIAGKNNTGKSALLEAIFTYTGEYDASRLLRATEMNLDDLDGSEWEPLFHNLDTNSPIRMCGGVAVAPPSPEERDGLEISIVDIDALPDNSRLIRFTAGEGPDVSSKFLEFKPGDGVAVHLAWSRRFYRNVRKPDLRFKTVFIPSSEMVPRSQDTKRFSKLLVERRSGNLLPVLREFEPRITGLALIGEPASIYGYLKGLEKPLPISTMGEGMRRITSLMLAIGSTEDGVVFIDEIENGLHYSIQTKVWQAIAEAAHEFNVQIFATTHSHEMILAAHEAFGEENLCDLRFFRLSRNREDKEIRAVAYEPETLDAAIEVGFEVR